MLHRAAVSNSGASGTPLLTPSRHVPQILPARAQPSNARRQAVIFTMAVLVTIALALVALLGGLRGSEPNAGPGGGKGEAAGEDAPPWVAALQRKPVLMPASYPLSQLRKGAALMNPELMQHAPTESTPYNASFKSPCWTDAQGQFKCLPYLVLMGGFHSGSGGIAHALSHHPDIVMTGSSGSQFWAEDAKTMSDYMKGHESGLPKLLAKPNSSVLVEASQSTFAFYASAGMKAHMRFVSAMRTCYTNCTGTFQRGEDIEACMQASCFRVAMEADKKASDEAGLDYRLDQHTPMLMRAVYGDKIPRLVALVRDPVERMHSAYWGYPHYQGKYGSTAEGFLEFVRDSIGAMRNCTSDYDPLRCALVYETLGVREEKTFYHCDQLLRGVYSVYVEVILRFFPPESLLLLRSEEVFADFPGAVVRVAQHAGLAPVTLKQAKAWSDKWTIPRHVKGRQMLPEARQLLHEFYAPYNRRLAALLNRPEFVTEWNDKQEALLKQPVAGNGTAPGGPA